MEDLIWYPFTQMKTASKPIFITRAKGLYLFDDMGNSLIDGISSWWVNLHGHAHPYIVEKIYAQAKDLEHVLLAGFTHAPAIDLAKKLISILPQGMSKIFYSDNGSTAVETALKMALQYWDNQKQSKNIIVGLRYSYHGDTFGAMSASGKNAFNKPFWNHLFETVIIDPPTPGKENLALAQLQTVLQTKKVACFIYEPLVLGVGGMKTYKEKPLLDMINLCMQANVLTIADEVMTGFGRTGPIFASPCCPDIMCLSKGLTGGFLPLGVTACKQKIFDAFYDDELPKALLHGHSYTANPLACQSAIASLDLLLNENCSFQRKMISQSHQEFCDQWKKHPKIKRCETVGTLLILEFLVEDSSYFQPIRDKLYAHFLERKVLIRPLGNVLYVMPPYCITKNELDLIYQSAKEFLEACA